MSATDTPGRKQPAGGLTRPDVLWSYEALLPHPIEPTFDLVVDLARAPYWHGFFTTIDPLTPPPIAVGSRWVIRVGPLRFPLSIVEVDRPYRVVFRGEPFLGMIAHFTIHFEPVAAATRIRYLIHPVVPSWLAPLMARLIPPLSRIDMRRYFLALDRRLGATAAR